MRVSRRAAILGLLIAVSACGSKSGSGTKPGETVLNIGSQKGGTKSLMLASGALAGAPYRVSWSEFPAAQHLLEAIGSGAVDVGLVGDAPFQFAWQSGSPIHAIGAQTAPGPRPDAALAIIVPKGSALHSIADLKGKSIATTRGSIGHYLVLQALDAAKLPPGSVRLTFLSPGDAKAAFSSGSVDAWATWTPYLTAALAEHARIIVDAKGFPRSYGFEVANDAAIAGKRAALADFLQREAKALVWVRSHQAEYAKVLARETGLPLQIASVVVEKNGRQSVPIDAAVIAAQHEVAERFATAGALPARRPVADGYDRSFAVTAIADRQ